VSGKREIFGEERRRNRPLKEGSDSPATRKTAGNAGCLLYRKGCYRKKKSSDKGEEKKSSASGKGRRKSRVTLDKG